MSISVDEAEHSIEMHLPYIAKVMVDFKDYFTIVPILVGSLTTGEEELYGSILAPYLADPQNLFVISSDFCHWGRRFRYTFYDKSWGEIHQSIQTLDRTVSIFVRMPTNIFFMPIKDSKCKVQITLSFQVNY